MSNSCSFKDFEPALQYIVCQYRFQYVECFVSALFRGARYYGHASWSVEVDNVRPPHYLPTLTFQGERHRHSARSGRVHYQRRITRIESDDSEVESLVASIVAKPRVAIALGKQLFYRQLEGGIEAAYEEAGRTMACNMMDESALEGVQAFIDKRPPGWAVSDRPLHSSV